MTGTASRGLYELGQVTADIVVLTVLDEEYEAMLGCLAAPDLLLGSEGAPNTYAWQLGAIDSPRYGAALRQIRRHARATAAELPVARREPVVNQPQRRLVQSYDAADPSLGPLTANWESLIYEPRTV